ncbi:bifunctional MCM [Babesia duncani]|uniref:DNA replication licensing factor MCM2 n=1 Tax=Babesia duncani TaxID=323732 RepID=A0AAD9PIR9_9APIC|nr:bifunctional MCM [Babesia duncani]
MCMEWHYNKFLIFQSLLSMASTWDNDDNSQIDDEELNSDIDRILDPEEREAELDAEDLYEDETGFVVGQADLQRELDGFAKLGIDNVNEYDPELLDDDVEYEDDPKARRAAERRMRYESRWRKAGETDRSVHQRLWRKILEMEDQEVEENLFERISMRVAKRRHGDVLKSDADAPDVALLEGSKQVLHSSPVGVTFDDKYQQAIDTCFRYFLYKFKLDESDTRCHYIERLHAMIRNDGTMLKIKAEHLLQFHCENLVTWLEFRPTETLVILHDCLTVEAHRVRPDLYAGRYCKVAIMDWPFSTSLSMIRSSELNTLIKVTGIVIRRGLVLPKLRVLYLKCTHCDSSLNETPIYYSDNTRPVFPTKCPFCQYSGFTVDRINTVYTDYQKLTIQEPPNSVAAGRTPRQRDVILTGDLVDSVKPGDLVEVLGIYKTRYDIGLNIKHGFPILRTELEANNVTRPTDSDWSVDLTPEDINEIHELSRDPCIRERLIASIAPSLWGHKSAKAAVCCALFGGVPKGGDAMAVDSTMGNQENVPDHVIMKQFGGFHKIRGDINVLLIGDPGLGKSQLLQYVHKTGHRTILTTGKGASAVGLTAGVRRDAMTGEWALEGGALVLADQGICAIDEFDKMTSKDRVSIHEAMEQQSISISKAGIVTTLRARCSVIAAANPKFGRYEPSYTFKENVDFTDPILSRFDLVMVMRDIPNYKEDSQLSEYVISNHQLLHPKLDNVINYQQITRHLKEQLESASACQPLSQEQFKKYVLYARRNCFPTVAQENYKEIEAKLSGFYSRIRQRTNFGGYPLTLRHIESIIRLSEVHAKMRLSNKILPNDVDLAIATLLESFISSQKHSVATRLSREFARYRILFQGSDDVLAQVLKGAIQKQIERNVRKAHAREMHRQEPDYTHPEQEQLDTFISLNLFCKEAQRYNFDKDRIQRWIHSSHFSTHFKQVTKNNVQGIQAL